MSGREPAFDACVGAMALEITSFDGTGPRASCAAEAAGPSGGCGLALEGSDWAASWSLAPRSGDAGTWDGRAEFSLLSGAVSGAGVGVCLDLPRWSRENYVLMPAAVYGGNRHRSLPKTYPPMLHADDGIGASMPVTVTDIPRLADGDGPSRIHLRSGDMATPCIGFHDPARKTGFLFLAEHDTAFGYTGLSLEESADGRSARLRLEAPAVRRTMYRMARTGVPSDDRGADFRAGDRVTLRFRIHAFDCPDLAAFFDRFFRVRQEPEEPAPAPHVLPLSAAFRIIEEKFQAHQWNPEPGYFRVDVAESASPFGDWQAGWVGGGMSSLAFLAEGGPLSRGRALGTMDTVFTKLQAPSGFIRPVMHRGRFLGDDYTRPEDARVCLIRKNADVLLFAARHILLLEKRGEPVPAAWTEGLRRLADAFLRLWKRHGQFGQFIDLDRGDILIGGTACGSSAPGGLALASGILGDPAYLDAAAASARHYAAEFLRRGLLNGGPGEILQGSDSESAFNLLESLMVLYGATGSREWLAPAEECARLCSSWCVSYDFHFPADSAFGRLGMRTTGSVYANVQNKHSAPGICTLSGASLLKLYRATGDGLYLRLCRETAHGITQYLSRTDRPVPSWDGGELPPGWMCERVNLCDWEGKDRVGGVFRGSCWCEVSCLLIYAEIPGIWLLSDCGEAVAFDHVDAHVSDAGASWRLLLSNPTAFDAVVKVFSEPRSAWARPWGECVLDGCPTVPVPARGEAVLLLKKERG